MKIRVRDMSQIRVPDEARQAVIEMALYKKITQAEAAAKLISVGAKVLMLREEASAS